MVQIIASANSVYDIPWPTSFSAFLDVMKLFLVDVITVRIHGPHGCAGNRLVSVPFG
jgi:hypothetical protein